MEDTFCFYENPASRTRAGRFDILALLTSIFYHDSGELARGQEGFLFANFAIG